MALTESAVIEALRPVNDPELGRSIVELDMVRQVAIAVARANSVNKASIRDDSSTISTTSLIRSILVKRSS